MNWNSLRVFNIFPRRYFTPVFIPVLLQQHFFIVIKLIDAPAVQVSWEIKLRPRRNLYLDVDTDWLPTTIAVPISVNIFVILGFREFSNFRNY